MVKTRIVGIRGLKKTLQLKKKVINNVDGLFKTTAIKTTRDAKINSPVKTGILRSSIKWRKRKHLFYEVHDGVSYGKFVEFGTINQKGQFFLRRAAEKNIKLLSRKVAKEY